MADANFGEHAMQSILRIIFVSLVLFVVGCTLLAPQRTKTPAMPFSEAIRLNAPAPCLPQLSQDGSRGGKVARVCADLIREDAGAYTLFFAEFDDQGWSYPKEYGAASEQMQHITDSMEILLQDPKEDLSVVVFAHGWKHNAASEDDNVKTFRELLFDLASLEEVAGNNCPRRVIGIYIGWRGAATTLGPVENLTFWNRKETAERIAQGDVRLLFARLRASQDFANRNWLAATQEVRRKTIASEPKDHVQIRAKEALTPISVCGKKMRLFTAGHSFGGLIVYTSIAQALVRDVADLAYVEAKQKEKSVPAAERDTPLLEREGDLVVVINPAIEATRLEPLYRAASEADLPRYHTPIFAAITSENDWATRRAFPVGRFLSTTFDKYTDSAERSQREANLYSFGHADSFVTHDLVLRERVPEASRAPTWCLEYIKGKTTFEERINSENQNLELFRRQLAAENGDATKIKARSFCGWQQMQLVSREPVLKWSGNSPIWNISTSDPIIKDHNDFNNPLLLQMLRQLYLETDDRERMRVQMMTN